MTTHHCCSDRAVVCVHAKIVFPLTLYLSRCRYASYLFSRPRIYPTNFAFLLSYSAIWTQTAARLSKAYFEFILPFLTSGVKSTPSARSASFSRRTFNSRDRQPFFADRAAASPAACPVAIQLPILLPAEWAMCVVEMHRPATNSPSSFSGGSWLSNTLVYVAACR